MTILVCGSMAYDTIMVFQDPFRKHILPDQIHILNVCFVVPTMRREFGGCAGNIAYNLKLLGEDPAIMATVGHDFGPYATRLEALGLSARHIRVLEDQFTAQAFITTDIEDNQITAFHPGAMGSSHLNRISEASGVRLGIVSPDGRDGMIEHARGLAEARIPFLFDPGQGLPMFSGEELLGMLKGAKALTVNDYEAKMFEEKTGRGLSEVAGMVEAVVMTRGAEGSTVFTGGQQFDVPAVKADGLVDPTGCGDAYRAGLLHGIAKGWDWKRCARLASVMGSIKIAHRGGQNHKPALGEIAQRYEKAFGEAL
ncbi:Adenosine kinase [Usitatibacter rugosus]|uniref:Adenosine kinase n=1 Tax=Usitatibacter rugosus TaxID=2732067 RepID=A0A6M4H1B1_9PROT|nr:carbohydrate kinase family protein [Usitatibacter rugosus]QJR13132.1 Adenosine kinase [Usitatibacter rugosus]